MPNMRFLRRLSLANYEATAHDIAALVEAPWFGQLTDLKLTLGWAGRSLCRSLKARQLPTNLESLTIRDWGKGLDDDAVMALLTATCLPKLRELDLHQNESITDRSLLALNDSQLLGQLRLVSLKVVTASHPRVLRRFGQIRGQGTFGSCRNEPRRRPISRLGCV